LLSDLFPIHHYFNIYVDQALNGVPIHYSLSSYLIMLAFLILPFFVFNRLKNAAIRQNYPTK